MNLIYRCSIYDPLNVTIGAEILETSPISIGVSYSVLCNIPASISSKYEKIIVSVKNEQLELNDARYSLSFYESPTILSLKPSTSNSYGGDTITVFGAKFLDPSITDATKIFCKFGDITCETVSFP